MYYGIAIVFWASAFIVCYAYAGYGVLLWLLVKIKQWAGSGEQIYVYDGELPEVTLLVTAYNERDFVAEKIKNSLELDYPEGKLKMVWITDGSDDGTPDLLRQYPEVVVYHRPERAGKIAAINRGMKLVGSPIVVFSDANTILGKESIMRMVRLFADPKVGCVSGEKRIYRKEKDMAAGAGEGLYWKYESFLKKYDARLYSVVGAAGELFAVRRALFAEVEHDTLLDDFIISLRIAMQGYIIRYDPEAYACETSSTNIREELKRKIRIAAGGIQSVVRLRPLLNIFKYGVLSFQYISHRVLRWTLAPLCMLLLLASNLALAWQAGFVPNNFFVITFCFQIVFYIMVVSGWFLKDRHIKLKILFVPYYFFIMNFAVYLGFFRYVRKKQDVRWERAKRNI
ncbi:MAG: glycosyltransferase family 2 protein [Bacteroidales bacterium]|jgi:cellulose synthase/poly-beta-1,6-N-acetylglucosamine synthase-like glycosyltransferase|nr:glycosyltransferase family 2 protein [Bacteroidales bacterium]